MLHRDPPATDGGSRHDGVSPIWPRSTRVNLILLQASHHIIATGEWRGRWKLKHSHVGDYRPSEKLRDYLISVSAEPEPWQRRPCRSWAVCDRGLNC